MIKSSVSRLLALALAISGACVTVFASDHANKTFLAPRPQGVNLALEYTTWQRQMRWFDEDKFGGTFQVVPWYQASTQPSKYGRYFGATNPLRGGVVDDFVGVSADTADKEMLHPRDLIHYYNAVNNGTAINPLKDRVRLSPEQRSFGVLLDYHQKLCMILDGLYFKIALPVVHVQNKLNAKSICKGGDCVARPSGVPNADNDGGQAPANGSFTLANYLSGGVSNTNPDNLQAALKKQKIVCGSHSTTGVADIDIMLGYAYRWEECNHVGISFGFTIPTGNTPNGEFLWEPRYGNGGHWGVGAGFDGALRLWCCDDMSLDFILAFNYRYLLKNDEVRMPHFKTTATPLNSGDGYTTMDAWQPYVLGGKTGSATLFPLANELTRSFDVTPGSQFDMIAQFAYNWCGFTAELGYNLYARESESVKLRGKDCGANTNLDIAIANRNFRTNVDFNASNDAHRNGGVITTGDFKLGSMETPSQLSHKLYGGLGYAFMEWEYPLMLGLHGSYEWASDNSVLSQWAVGGKIGVTF